MAHPVPAIAMAHARETIASVGWDEKPSSAAYEQASGGPVTLITGS